MKGDDDQRSATNLAKTLAMMCVRNTSLEQLHAGRSPVSKRGDCTDIKVVDANGEIPWPDVSRLDDDDMKKLMKQIVDRLYTFFLKADDPYFQEAIYRWAAAAQNWDPPELDETFLNMIEQRKARHAD
jgi:hypothetical protein